MPALPPLATGLLPLWADHVGISASTTSLVFALAGAIVVLMLTTAEGRFQMLAVAVVVGVIALAGVLWTRTDAFARERGSHEY